MRNRLLLANAAGGSVVLAYGQLALGEGLAPQVDLSIVMPAYNEAVGIERRMVALDAGGGALLVGYRLVDLHLCAGIAH